MREEIVDELACPMCRGPLRLADGAVVAQAVETGTLSCACGRSFAIRRGVPRLLPDHIGALDTRIAAAFGYEWTHFHIDYADATEHFLDWIAPLRGEDFAGKRIVDAGCGMGRHARAAARFGARAVYAMDLSDAVDVARRYTRDEPNVHVLQADLRYPPLRGPFDLVYSIGVLNQLPAPEAGFVALARLLRPGGALCAWVYAAEAGRAVSHVIDPLRARCTSRLPFPLLRWLTWPVAALLFAVSHGVYRPIIRAAPALRDRLPWGTYLEQLGGFPFSLLHCTIFDQLVAPAARYCTQEELRGFFAAAGLDSPTISLRHGNGWRGLAYRGARE
jgi:SAM-dependent methyltransferase